jgi:hypothetical protein
MYPQPPPQQQQMQAPYVQVMQPQQFIDRSTKQARAYTRSR